MNLNRRELFQALAGFVIASKMPEANAAVIIQPTGPTPDSDCHLYEFTEEDGVNLVFTQPPNPVNDQIYFNNYYRLLAKPADRFVTLSVDPYSGTEGAPFQHRRFRVVIRFGDGFSLDFKVLVESSWVEGSNGCKRAGFTGMLMRQEVDWSSIDPLKRDNEL